MKKDYTKFKRDGRGGYYNDKYRIYQFQISPPIWVLEKKDDDGDWIYKTESTTKRECVEEIKYGWE